LIAVPAGLPSTIIWTVCFVSVLGAGFGASSTELVAM